MNNLKLDMNSKSFTQSNIDILKKLFPNCVSDEKIDFEMFFQIIYESKIDQNIFHFFVKNLNFFIKNMMK